MEVKIIYRVFELRSYFEVNNGDFLVRITVQEPNELSKSRKSGKSGVLNKRSQHRIIGLEK